MKAEYINPFISSTSNVFKTMVGIEPIKGDVYVKKANERMAYDVSGVIGLAGQASGSIVISLPTKLALKIVEGFLGEKKTEIDDDVTDAVGEILNMIAGGAKQIFSQIGLSFKISIPNVIVGRDHMITKHSTINCLGVKFKVGDQIFVIEAALKDK